MRDTLDQFVLHFEAWKKKRPKQRINDLECTAYSLKAEIIQMQKILEKGRFHNFIWTIPYIRGMEISLVDERPKPIKLEDLERRMAQVEAVLQNRDVSGSRTASQKGIES